MDYKSQYQFRRYSHGHEEKCSIYSDHKLVQTGWPEGIMCKRQSYSRTDEMSTDITLHEQIMLLQNLYAVT